MQPSSVALATPGNTTALCSDPFAVRPEWLDLYGHMNAARYFEVFVDVGYELLGHAGFGEAYTRTQRRGIFLVDARIQYWHELRERRRISVRLRILAADALRMHVLLEMADEDQQRVAAVMQQLFVHVDLDKRKPAPFAPDTARSIDQLLRRHAAMPLPDGVERSLDWRQRRAPNPGPRA